MAKLAEWGNDLYTGKRSYDFVGKRKWWFLIAAILVVASVLVPVAKGGFNLGIEFRGGNEFQVSQVQTESIDKGVDAVESIAPDAEPKITKQNSTTMRVHTNTLKNADQGTEVRQALAKAYDTDVKNVSMSSIGPTWGADVSKQAGVGLVVFIVLVALLMALYFRTWKMSMAAIIGLLFVVVVTAGIYSVSNFEVTPSAIIGFLTILSYSLYDTVVVFDKVRENTHDTSEQRVLTFGEQVNRAVNQTLVRSINTSVVAILPVGSILFIGAFLLGAGTLADLSLAIFVGIIVSALSTLFIQAPLYAQFRVTEEAVKEHDEAILAARPQD
ncbi:MAG: protein translocase subunit SecF [Galactobacter sp.]|uniref:protein translocase subunit SecF n=1 Tax=Galactobacter sp. TaxID=2676125 RepID=UPI0025C1BAE4|nr:protein translocase subunit SecF [Galactobacter sp.]